MARDKVSSGDPIRPRAALWNDMVDAARAHKARRLTTGRGDVFAAIPRDRVWVKNTAGEDLPIGSVVEIGDYAFDDDQLGQDQFYFECDKPSDAGAVHTILRQPIPDGEIGEAQLIGVVVARVAVNDVAHTCCLVVESETELKSAPIGPHRLIHAPDTGSQLCAVILGGGILLAHGVAVDEIEQDATGTITIAGKEVEAKNHTGPTIEEGARVRAYIESGEVHAEPLECSS